VQLLLTAVNEMSILYVQSYFARHYNASNESIFSYFLAQFLVHG